MIYVECNPDEVLVRTITKLPKKQIDHELKGKYEICKLVSKNTNSKALIDEDPGTVVPGYLRNRTAHELQELGLKVYRDQRQGNTIVALSPRLEEWIVKTAQEAGLDMADYDLPRDPYALHKVINLKQNPYRFKTLLQALVRRHSQRIAGLREYLFSDAGQRHASSSRNPR